MIKVDLPFEAAAAVVFVADISALGARKTPM